MPIAWKTTATTAQIKVQSVRFIGPPRPTAGMWSSRLGAADLRARRRGPRP